MIGFSHAEDMLKAVKMGHAIEIMPTDDLEAFAKVFADFMQTQEYYMLPPDTQEYLRDVLVAVSTYGQEQEAFLAQQAERTVFPRTETNPQKFVEDAASLGSPLAAAQMADKMPAMGARRAVADGEPNPEHGIGRTRMGGGG